MSLQDDSVQASTLAPTEWADDYLEPEEQQEESYDSGQYEITASPNDFNISTIFSFIESGAVRIPNFQRNYVWDIQRASRLIESILIGLPIPQIFLYEESRNKFLVIDGQQRLLSIYYFMKLRFPRKEKRNELRRIFDENGRIPDDYRDNDQYFQKFNLRLPRRVPTDVPNRFDGLNYGTLGDYQTTFDLRTIRNVIIRQNFPRDDMSSIYEIFFRLNTGGVNLTPQEIRTSLYHSEFYELLTMLNIDPRWRRFTGMAEPDVRMKDMEILLRAFAMVVGLDWYRRPMTRFLNAFSQECKSLDEKEITYYRDLFDSFLKSSSNLEDSAFLTRRGQFNISLFEAVFFSMCRGVYETKSLVIGMVDGAAIEKLRTDETFIVASQEGSSDPRNVTARIDRARALVTVAG